jgi:hypothetical protein
MPAFFPATGGDDSAVLGIPGPALGFCDFIVELMFDGPSL